MKKPMLKKLLVGGTLLMLAAAPVLAVEHGTNELQVTYTHAPFYRANEFSLDVFGTASLGGTSLDNLTGAAIRNDTEFGVGVGVNYFFTRYLGVGVDAYSENTTGAFVDSMSGNLIGRFPLGESGFAPYVYGGGGYQFDLTESWFVQLGAGMEYRFTPNIGTFFDARWVLPDGEKYYGVLRLGLRFAL